MWLIPYEKLYIKPRLSQDKIIQKLQDITDTSRKIVWFPTFASKQHKPYLGKINNESFSIYRWINHQDSFLPIIDGKFISQNSESTITIKMHLHWSIAIFMTLWLGFFGAVLVNQIFEVITYFFQSGSLPLDTAIIIMPTFFFFFGYGMMIIVFKIDARREKQFIQELTEAYEMIELGVFQTEES